MIFITGSTGFLGGQLLQRLLAVYHDAQFCLLVRPQGDKTASTRIEETLNRLFGPTQAKRYLQRILPIPGDFTLENFGLGDSAFKNFASKTSTIYHSAACTMLDRPLAQSRTINVGGTKQVLKFAALAQKLNPNFNRLNHLSTAYVVGDTRAIVTPDQLSTTTNFRNGYEQAKAESEALVRSYEEIPHTIYRPSVIVGDSTTGQTSTFNVIYVPARFLANGLLKVLPAFPRIPFDIVPIDYVSDTIVALSKKNLQGNQYFHLCAGVGRETNPKEILDIIVNAVNTNRHKSRKQLSTPPLISPDVVIKMATSLSAAREGVKQFEQLVAKNLVVIKQILPFIPYMIGNPRFDTTHTQRELQGEVPPAPLFKLYAPTLFQYCLDTNWGKLPWTSSEKPKLGNFHLQPASNIL